MIVLGSRLLNHDPWLIISWRCRVGRIEPHNDLLGLPIGLTYEAYLKSTLFSFILIDASYVDPERYWRLTLKMDKRCKEIGRNIIILVSSTKDSVGTICLTPCVRPSLVPWTLGDGKLLKLDGHRTVGGFRSRSRAYCDLNQTIWACYCHREDVISDNKSLLT